MRLAERFAKLEVLVIGDAMLDAFIEGTSSRSCPDAPEAPVVDQTSPPKLYLGGAGNVAANCRALGAASVTLVGVAGSGEEGANLIDMLTFHGIRSSIVTPLEGTTLVKTRLVADGKIIARIDRGSVEPIGGRTADEVEAGIVQAWTEADVVLVADYGHGVMTRAIIELIAKLQRHEPRTLVVDAKDLRKYRECSPTAVCPNYEQFRRLIGFPSGLFPSDRREFIDGCRSLALERSGAKIIAVTLDREGVMTLDRERRPAFVEANPVDDPHTSGAGDTFAAAFGLCLASGMGRVEAAEIAQRAAEVACDKPCTATCYVAELEPSSGPAVEQPQRPKTVLACGCFDVLHAGHVALLAEARRLAGPDGRVVVGINSDRSVGALKPGRPFNSLHDRVKMLEALRTVDQVISFESDTPESVVRRVRPKIYLKGDDYSLETLPEASAVEACGGKVVFFRRVPGKSTTYIIDRARFQFGSGYTINETRSALGLGPIPKSAEPVLVGACETATCLPPSWRGNDISG